MLYLLLFVASVCVAVSVLVGLSVVESRPKTKLGWSLASAVTFVALLFVGGTFSSPFWWEFPALGNVVISVKEDGTATTSEFFGVPDWGGRMVSNVSPDKYTATVTVQPVTVNPKVRHLVSVLTARVADSLKYTVSGARKDWDKYFFIAQVESAIYEFHEKHSVELGEFYNPHDGTQQARFYALATGAIGPRLAQNGIEITNARFSM